jgi:hypothetical protein
MTTEPQGKTCPKFRFHTSPSAPLAHRSTKALFPLSGRCGSPGRGRLWRLPSTKAREEAKEIAIRVDDDELPIARFFVALSVPALLKRDMDGGARL